MRVKINLSTRTYIDTGKLDVILCVLALVLLACLLLNIRTVATHVGELKRLGSDVARMEGKDRNKVDEKEYQKLLSRIAFANGVISKKSYNWLLLFDRLETVIPDGVAITSLEPDQKTHDLRLSGVARNFASVRQFMENLEDARFMSEVYLLSHSDTKVGATQRGTVFSISCKVMTQ
jgi:type IV pilus assembly protein PilN